MRRKNYKGKCQKRVLEKCKNVCKTYSPIQYNYADVLQKDDNIKEFKCNVLLTGELENYVSDFVCIKLNNEIMVRECVYRKHLTKPMTIEMLDHSKEYWLRCGVKDWGIIIDAEK